MTREPLLQASLPIRIHAFTIIPAFLIGCWMLWGSRKGSPAHRVAGGLYVALMLVSVISAVFIEAAILPLVQLGALTLGPIHLLVIYTLLGIAQAVRALRCGDYSRHGAAMRGVFFGGLLIAGAFTLLPGRIMHRMIFGG
jgi:uncharacterized membrane protein